MAEPFVSHDGADPSGFRAEVWVETGTGIVEKIERSGTSDNYQVKMRCEKLKHPVQGWLRSDDPLYPKALELLESRREVAYRIESKRKPNVPRETPIAELRKDMETAKNHIVKIMAGLDGTLAGEALTNPAEDRPSGTYSANNPQPAATAAPAAGPSALSLDAAMTGLVTARQAGLPPSVVDACTALALAAGATAQQVQNAGIKSDHAERPQVRRPHAVEAKAWEQYNTDGRVNLGSYVVHAALSAVDKAYELLTERNQRIAESTGKEANTPQDAQVVAVANLLMNFADQVQVAAYEGGKPERGASSHVRCRGLVYAAIANFPIPIRNADEEKDAFVEREMAWRSQIVAESVSRWKLALAVLTGPEQAAAQQANTQQASQQANAQQAPALSVVKDAPASQEASPAAPSVPAALSVVHDAPAQVPFDSDTISFAPTVARVAEGQPGFQVPSDASLAMLRAMATHPDVSDPHTVGSLLLVLLGQKMARMNHGPALDELIAHYRSLGEDGPMTFAKDASLAHGKVTAAQAS